MIRYSVPVFDSVTDTSLSCMPATTRQLHCAKSQLCSVAGFCIVYSVTSLQQCYSFSPAARRMSALLHWVVLAAAATLVLLLLCNTLLGLRLFPVVTMCTDAALLLFLHCIVLTAAATLVLLSCTLHLSFCLFCNGQVWTEAALLLRYCTGLF